MHILIYIYHWRRRKPAGWKKPKLYVGRIPYEKLADPASPKAEELYAMIADTATATPAEKGI